MVTLKEEDSNIYGEVFDEMKKASADYQAVSLEVSQLKADNKTVSKEKKKEKYDKVFWHTTVDVTAFLSVFLTPYQGIAFKNLERMHDQTKANATLVHIHFKQLGLTKYARTESIHLVDVIGKMSRVVMMLYTKLTDSSA